MKFMRDKGLGTKFIAVMVTIVFMQKNPKRETD